MMLEAVDLTRTSKSSLGGKDASQSAAPGPLFKEIYAGILDVEDPNEWRPVFEADTRSFLAHTTDIQTLDQFKNIHRIPEKWGTAYHHRAYVATIESLQA